ncbi:MAG: hypothetical protein IH819_09625 [Bacteroidetes bacterium]|nr:hypothetical protein [Bacteroidota bacterium]
MLTKEENNTDKKETPPPILKSWNKLYALVFVNLVVLVILFYIFTKVFE